MTGFHWQVFNYEHMRSFLAVVETRSLSAAARQLGMSQPTLGRHIRELEAAYGAALFKRGAKGVEPTHAASGLIDDAIAMGRAADALALKIKGIPRGWQEPFGSLHRSS